MGELSEKEVSFMEQRDLILVKFPFSDFETLKFHHSLSGGLSRKPLIGIMEFGVLKNKYDA